MPIDPDTLDTVARRHVAPMTSIRGRRVHRLLLRTFAGFDAVLSATAADGEAAVVGIAADGRLSVCRSDGRGAAAEVVACALAGATVTTAHDLLKDSLPIVRWTIAHPGLDGAAGALTVSAAGLSPAAASAVARLLAGRAAP